MRAHPYGAIIAIVAGGVLGAASSASAQVNPFGPTAVCLRRCSSHGRSSRYCRASTINSGTSITL